MQIQLDLSKHRVLLMKSLTCKTFFYDFFYLFHFVSLSGVTYSVVQSLFLEQYLLAIFPIFVIVYWLFTTINYFSLYNDNYKETILAAGAFVTTYLGVLNTNTKLNTFNIFMIEFLTIITYFIISMTYYHHIHVITKILEANYLAFLLTKFDLPKVEHLPKILRSKGKEAIESYQFEFNNLAQVENLSYQNITLASPNKKHHKVADFEKQQPYSGDIESPSVLELANARDLPSPSYASPLLPVVASSKAAFGTPVPKAVALSSFDPPPSAQKSIGYVAYSEPPIRPSVPTSVYITASAPAKPWVCNKCSSIISGEAQNCPKCGLSKPITNGKLSHPREEESKAQEPKNKQTPDQVSDFWTCSTCTYNNNSEERQNCAVCDAPKPKLISEGVNDDEEDDMMLL